MTPNLKKRFIAVKDFIVFVCTALAALYFFYLVSNDIHDQERLNSEQHTLVDR